MPPLYHDPLSAVPGTEWRWLALAHTALEVACEPWALALVALALYSFQERDVKGVLKSFAPLAAALTVAAAVALAARAVGGVPRPLDAVGHALGPILRRAFPTAQTAAVAVFATYTALAYGRRAGIAVLAVVAVGIARGAGRPHWATDLVGGGVAGVLLAAAAYAVAVWLGRRGHLLRLGAGGGPPGRPEPGSP